MISKIFDVFCASLILLSLYYIPKHKKWWLVYSVGCVLYIFLMLIKGLWGATILDIVAAIIGIKNYLDKWD